MVFTTVGPTPGAIVVEWNVQQPDGVQAGTGMWDSHIRYVTSFCVGSYMLIAIVRLGGGTQLVYLIRLFFNHVVTHSFWNQLGRKHVSEIQCFQLRPLLCGVHGASHHTICFRIL